MELLSKDAPIRVETLEDGALWRVVIGGSKGNVLDGAAMGCLETVFTAAGREPTLRAVVLQGEGRHFTFGASVQEHLPEQAEEMLSRFRRTLLALFDSSVVYLAAVRGVCLGGGLELACCCHRIFAAPGVKLGQPEITLGVFAPVASVVLVERIGRGAAEELCLSGRAVADVVKAYDAGVVAAPAPADIYQAAARLLDDPQSLQKCGENGLRATREVLSLDAHGRALRDYYEKVAA